MKQMRNRGMGLQKLLLIAVFFFADISISENRFAGAQEPDGPTASVLATIRNAVSDSSGSKPFTFHKAPFTQNTRDLPIGVFDSGIGGLTVMEAILGLDSHNNKTFQPKPDGVPDFESEQFIYLGDQANMPYGNYASVGKLDFLRELILRDAIFLLGKRYWKDSSAQQPSLDKPPVKAIAIGCNTATAYGLEDIKTAIKHWNVPVFVVGVVDAGARGLLELSAESSKPQATIAVLATVGTCNSGAYPRAIRSTLGLAGRQIPTVVQKGFVELAAAIEGDTQVLSKGSVREFIERDVLDLVEEHRKSGDLRPISTVILGCTHFPLVESQIIAVFKSLREKEVDGQLVYSKLIAEKIEVVNPAQLAAKELFRTLASSNLRRTHDAVQHSKKVQFFISVPNPSSPNIQLTADGSLEHDYKYGRATQQFDVEDTRFVPMKQEMLPVSSLNMLKTSLPNVWRIFSN
jgi:glutamate racemase